MTTAVAHRCRPLQHRRLQCFLASSILSVFTWTTLYAFQCAYCYRLGNFIDFYFQHEILSNALMHGFPNADATVPLRHTLGLARSVRFHRFLWLSRPPPMTLIEMLHSTRANELPYEFWMQPPGKELLDTLILGARESKTYGDYKSDYFIWWEPRYMYMLLPYLQSNLRAAIATLQKGNRNIRAGTDNCTCVVHFRAVTSPTRLA